MQAFEDKVAVITGAASGIGRALAERAAREGMKVVLADVEEQALAQTAEELRAAGADVLPVTADVSQAADVEALATRTLEAFGAVHLLCNNAGVAAGGRIWEIGVADWEWVLGVNLWGVIHGLRSFVPIMLAQDTECHIVNTASIAGLTSSPGLGAYQVTKHGVVTLSETLYHELALQQAKIDVSVLCPAWVRTRIVEAYRNRPVSAANDSVDRPVSAKERRQIEAMRRVVAAGIPPEQVADEVFDAVRTKRFYILTHPDFTALVQKRMEDILDGRNPSFPRL